jgi:hypothetical protein
MAKQLLRAALMVVAAGIPAAASTPSGSGAAGAQDSDFESADYGIKLKIPKGWNIDATRQARVILKLNLPGEAAVKPELLVHDAPFPDPITLPQYKEQLRHYLQRAYKEPWMLDDRPIKVGGRDGFVLSLSSKSTSDADIVSHKGLIMISPRHFLGVDGVFPKAQQEELLKVYDTLLSTIEFIPRRQPVGAEDGVKKLGEALDKLTEPWTPPGADDISIFLGEKEIGTQTIVLRAATQGGAAGLDLDMFTKIDLGDDGRSEARITGFLSNDLATQSIQLSEIRVGKDKRVQSFTASAALSGGELKIDGRINGERATWAFKAPARAVFSEFMDPLQRRLLGAGKGFVMVPTVQAFDHDPMILKLELGGAHKMRVDDQTVEVQVVYQAREDGALVTYWYDADRRLTRITSSSQGPVFKRKK